MTRDEAISIMNVIVHMLEPQYDTDRIEEAVEMAIKALKQQPTDAVDRVTIKEYLYSLGMGIKVTATDAVDRQEAINAAIEGADKWDGGYNNEREKCIREEIAKLPSVTPQPKVGKWIYRKEEDSYRCSLCTYPCHKDNLGAIPTMYCAGCGAYMQEVQNE